MKANTIRPTRIEKRPLLYLIIAAQASNFYHGFNNALDIFSPKIKMLVSSKFVLFFYRKSAVGFSYGVSGVERVKFCCVGIGELCAFQDVTDSEKLN